MHVSPNRPLHVIKKPLYVVTLKPSEVSNMHLQRSLLQHWLNLLDGAEGSSDKSPNATHQNPAVEPTRNDGWLQAINHDALSIFRRKEEKSQLKKEGVDMYSWNAKKGLFLSPLGGT